MHYLFQGGILMRRAKAPKVYMQKENPTGIDCLVQFIKEKLPEGKERKAKQEKLVKQQMKELKASDASSKGDKTSFNVRLNGFPLHIIQYVSC